jgi:hypothetical protein
MKDDIILGYWETVRDINEGFERVKDMRRF